MITHGEVLGKVNMAKGRLLIALVLLSLAFCLPLSAQTRRLGDLNNDNVLTTLDYSLLLNHLNATNTGRTPAYPGSTNRISTPLLGYADATGDGRIDANDLHRLVDGILGLPLNPLPRPLEFYPAHESFIDQTNQIAAVFNQPISPLTLTANTMTLRHSGPNALLGDADDTNITFGFLFYSNAAQAVGWTFPTNLPAGAYRATILPPITNSAGLAMSIPYSWEFKTLGGLDSDGDGVPDSIEIEIGLNPFNPITFADGVRDGDRDYDGDDFSNSNEVFRATDLARWDTDGDGWADGVEVADGKDPLNPSSHPQWSVFARPPVEIASLDGETLGIGNFGTIVARPPVEITRPGQDEAPGPGSLGTLVARPPIEITRPAPGEALGLDNLGVIVARPPVEITRPAQGEAEDLVGGGIIIARPPVELTRPAENEVQGLAPGNLVARPPVEIARPAASEDAAAGVGNIVARPPITITNQPAFAPALK